MRDMKTTQEAFDKGYWPNQDIRRQNRENNPERMRSGSELPENQRQ